MTNNPSSDKALERGATVFCVSTIIQIICANMGCFRFGIPTWAYIIIALTFAYLGMCATEVYDNDNREDADDKNPFIIIGLYIPMMILLAPFAPLCIAARVIRRMKHRSAD